MVERWIVEDSIGRYVRARVFIDVFTFVVGDNGNGRFLSIELVLW